MDLTVFIREEGAGYWSEISELPGCFASGRDLTDLREALGEAIGLYLFDQPVNLEESDLRVGRSMISVRPPPAT